LAPWQGQCPLVYVKMDAVCSSETQMTFTGPHSVISQKTELFIATAARTSGLTEFSCFTSLQSYLGPCHEDGNSSHPAWHSQHSR
jgi:hypothetical protein